MQTTLNFIKNMKLQVFRCKIYNNKKTLYYLIVIFDVPCDVKITCYPQVITVYANLT